MKKDLADIVQKCVYCNFIISDLIKYNDSSTKTLFITIKNENLINIKTLCYLYEYLYQDVLILQNVNDVDLNKDFNKNIKYLFKLFFEIISDLKTLFSRIKDRYCKQYINRLIFSYFAFTSYINSYLPIIQNKYNEIENFSLLCIRDSDYLDSNPSENKIREICIKSVELFFDYYFKDSVLKDETCEIFFDNDPNNKFYQYFFDCYDRSIKIRISYKNTSVFYMYQVLKNPLETSPIMTNEEARTYSESFLKEKLKDDFNMLVFDRDYLNIYSYMNIPESYKFKYNFKDSSGKVNLNKGLYITIDACSIYVQELYLF